MERRPLSGPNSLGRWRFAAHLGYARPDEPMLPATAGSVDPVAQVACAAALGFAAITDNCLKLRPPEVQHGIGAALRAHGLVMGSFTYNALAAEPPFFWGMPIADVGAALSDALAAAERVGGGCINVILLNAGLPRDEQIARATENFARAAEIVAARGFAMAMEPASRERVPLSLVERAAEAAAIVRATGPDHLGLILDSCHCLYAGDDMAAEIVAQADRLAIVQLADMPGRVEPGAGGLIDFDPIVAALEAIGWQGLIEAEFNPAQSGAAGEQRAVAALARL